eukprot:Skav234154  [mRNA]  locus=scaffold6570:34119:42615:- [translate_table: standard]
MSWNLSKDSITREADLFGVDTDRTLAAHFPATGEACILEPVERALQKLPQPCKLRLAVFDHVSSYPPAILPVTQLARMVKARCPEAFVLLDGAHALGQIAIDMKELAEAGVDAYAHWIRVSSQIYLDPKDFLSLTDAVMTLRQSCKSSWFRLDSVTI